MLLREWITWNIIHLSVMYNIAYSGKYNMDPCVFCEAIRLTVCVKGLEIWSPTWGHVLQIVFKATLTVMT